MSEQIQLGQLRRDLQVVDLTLQRDAKEFSRLQFSASSDKPIEMGIPGMGMMKEVLSHEPSAIRSERFAAGAIPVLFNHNRDDPIGMVDSASLASGRMLVDAHLFNTERAWSVKAMVEGGLRNISMGYRVHTYEQGRANKDTLTATDWEPLEVSVVTVPADPGVGIGRDNHDGLQDVEIVRHNEQVSTNERELPIAAGAAPSGVAMSDVITAPAADTKAANPAETKRGPSSAEFEAQRVKGLENLCALNNIGKDQRERWVADGTDVVQASDEILQIVKERGERNPNPVTKLGLTNKEKQQFSIARMVLAIESKDFGAAGFEVECSREIATRLGKSPNPHKFYVPFDIQQRPVEDDPRRGQRDLTVATAGAGGYLVQTSNQGFIDILRNRSVVMSMGANRLPGLRDSITIPRQTVAGTAVWLANEASTITESTPTFVQIALSPKNVGAYSEISRQLLLQSNPAAESIVTNDLAQQVALAADLAALEGSGASGQPTGISNTAGIGSVTGTSIAFAGILEFQTDVAGANVRPVQGGYVTTPTVAALLIQRVKYTSTASPLWEGNVWDGTMQGYRAMTTNAVTAATMVFGDWNNIIIAEWGTLEVEVNPYANFQAGIIGVRAIYSMDVGVRIPASFSRSTSIT